MACLILLVTSATMPADVKPASLFSHNMVLQRGAEVPVWGTAVAGEEVTVTFAGQSLSAITRRSCKWQVTLAPMEANAEPQERTIQGVNTVTVTNVVVGDVWLCSGQSNMAFIAFKHVGKGLVAPMLENYSSQLIWRLMHQNKHIQKGLEVLGFRHVRLRE